MSRCIDLFIDAPLPVDDLAAELGRLTGITFVGAVEGSRWVVRDGDAAAELVEHDFVDDRHLVLSRYRYDLFAMVDGDHVAECPNVVLLRRVLAALRDDGRYPALLVFDLQHALDRADGRAAPGPPQ
jgi:hypothetical protein